MASAATNNDEKAGSRVSPLSPDPLSTDGVDFKPGRWWTNIFNAFSGRMSEVGMMKLKIDSDLKNEEADCKRCETHRDYLLQYSKHMAYPPSRAEPELIPGPRSHHSLLAG